MWCMLLLLLLFVVTSWHVAIAFTASFHRNSFVSRSRIASYSFSTALESPSTKLQQHEQLVEGKLDNGLEYIILPNSSPANRFEAHLEILSGSIHELPYQQGMAHLLEHVTYMGSKKRQALAGTNSRTNAYTDFHHTVFFASCPTYQSSSSPLSLPLLPSLKTPMLPMALDALVDVLTTTVEDDRLEKERAAVLSEASMVNKMDYRVEVQVLSALHQENRIATRFPIGKEHLIRTWNKKDLQAYHKAHYHPANALLYVVGDVNTKEVEETIKEKFGPLHRGPDTMQLLAQEGEYPIVNMRRVHKNYPPVVHRWSCSANRSLALLPPELVSPVQLPPAKLHNFTIPLSSSAAMETQEIFIPTPSLFVHELLQSFSFHLFAKRPIDMVVTRDAVRRELMRRIVLSAMQIRFNVGQRQQPLFTFVDFIQESWAREGCAVCSLDFSTEPSLWKEGVTKAVQEIRRMGLFGISEYELRRHQATILAQATQSLSQVNEITHEEVIEHLMRTRAIGSTFLGSVEQQRLVQELLPTITVADVSEMAKELCEHLSHIDSAAGVQPAAIVVCSPMKDRHGESFVIAEQDVVDVIRDALQQPLEPSVDVIVPTTLITAEELERKKQLHPPTWTTVLPNSKALISQPFVGLTQRRLSNGIRINSFHNTGESNQVQVRMFVPGGRLLEGTTTTTDRIKSRLIKNGAIALGVKTLQEGGAFLNVTREQAELFCIEHDLMLEAYTKDDGFYFDFSVSTLSNALPHLRNENDNDDNNNNNNNNNSGVSGLEAILQVMHVILTDLKWEEDAFHRAKLTLHEDFDSSVKSLESTCYHQLMSRLTNNNKHFLPPTHEDLNALTLEEVKESVQATMKPHFIEVTVSGDVGQQTVEPLLLNYLGSIPNEVNEANRSVFPELGVMAVDNSAMGSSLHVYLNDSDERAMGYVAGEAPNKFGVFANGETLTWRMNQLYQHHQEGDNNNSNNNNNNNNNRFPHRQHPYFAFALLNVLKEIVNRKLFAKLREELNLTYDSNLEFRQQSEGMLGGCFVVSITSPVATVQQAVIAAQHCLLSLSESSQVRPDTIQHVVNTLVSQNRENEMGTNRYWINHLTSTQLDDIFTTTTTTATTTASSLLGKGKRKPETVGVEYESVLHSIKQQDILDAIKVLHWLPLRNTNKNKKKNDSVDVDVDVDVDVEKNSNKNIDFIEWTEDDTDETIASKLKMVTCVGVAAPTKPLFMLS